MGWENKVYSRYDMGWYNPPDIGFRNYGYDGTGVNMDISNLAEGINGGISLDYNSVPIPKDEYTNIDSVLTGTLASNTSGGISAWVRSNDGFQALLQTIMSFGNSDGISSDTLYFSINSGSAGKLRGYLRDGVAIQWIFTTNNSLFVDNENDWHHCMLIHDGVEPFVMFDGDVAPVTFSTSTDKTKWINNLNVDMASIGTGRFFGSISGYMDGRLDDVFIFDSPLTVLEAKDFYQRSRRGHI
jgi:hypothetical protein